MKSLSYLIRQWLLALCLLSTVSFSGCVSKSTQSFEASSNLNGLPAAYLKAGLSDAQAARILLDRFTFGSRSGDIDSVLATGLAPWFAQQLAAEQDETVLDKHLAKFDVLGMSDAKLMARFPSFSAASAHARRFFPGVLPPRDKPVVDFSIIADKLAAFAKEQGMERMEQTLLPQLYGQKVIRAVYAENQLQAVMVDFWQNHFFTGVHSFAARPWLVGFERDVIRPKALASFIELLKASTRHPALLEYYRRDAQPIGISAEHSLMALKAKELRKDSKIDNSEVVIAEARQSVAQIDNEFDLILKRQFWANTGPNLALAEALLKLHTLGPDTQFAESDIEAVARIFTGWTVFPYGASDEWFDIDSRATEVLGFKRSGSFWFRADHHDAREKNFLGRKFRAGSGLADGDRLLKLLAEHPATAEHIATKLIQRFVGKHTDPLLTEKLQDKLSGAFRNSNGDIPTVLTALVTSPEFWQAAADRNKLKTPLQFAVSALRASEATIDDTRATVEWIGRLGQPLYAYLEPAGYPQDGKAWLESGSMLARINFVAALQQQDIAGVTIPGREYARTHSTPPNSTRSLAMSLAAPEFQFH